MSISASKTGKNETTITLSDEFGYLNIEEFRRAYEGVDQCQSHAYVIDFRNTQYIDSSGLGLLLNARKFCTNNGGSIRIINAKNNVKRVFQISRFEKYFIID